MACVTMSIKVTFTPTPIFGIINGTSLGITCFFQKNYLIINNYNKYFHKFYGQKKNTRNNNKFNSFYNKL
jgi:hypothetical protein